MSTQDTAALIESVNNMTATVAGKMSEIDQRVETAEQEFKEFENEADDRYKLRTGTKFYVGGQADKFIPVIFLLPMQPISNIEVHRSVLYEDASQNGHSEIPGTTSISVEALAASWGHRVGFTHIIAHYHKESQMLADYANDYRCSHLVLWLRGGLHYTIFHDQANITIDNVITYTDEISDFSSIFGNKITVALGGVVDAGSYGVSYPVKTELNPSIPTNYRLGVTSGS